LRGAEADGLAPGAAIAKDEQRESDKAHRAGSGVATKTYVALEKV
jgi:hypothetical protein